MTPEEAACAQFENHLQVCQGCRDADLSKQKSKPTYEVIKNV